LSQKEHRIMTAHADDPAPADAPGHAVGKAFGPGSPTLLFAGIAVLAFVVRLTPLLLGGGLGSYGRYDDGVYYAAADSLTFGRVPYRDFTLLHPPGITLVLAPFALLGRVTSDPVGMATGRLAFIAIGSLNAVLVTALACRWGRFTALAAGTLYACWLPATYAEQSTLLEPLGGTALLVALLLLLNTTRAPTVRAEVMAGVAVGLACTMKIWYVAPFAAVVVWQLAARKPRAAARVAVGGVAALLVVLAPFLILARGRMFDMVVRDQLRRPPPTTPRAKRLSSIVGIDTFLRGHQTEIAILTTVAMILLAAAAVACLLDRHARVIVWVLAVNLVVLLASPSYFPHYAALTAGPMALVATIALGKLVAALRARTVISGLVLAVSLLAFLGSGARIAATAQGKTFPGAAFATAAPAGCVAADDPETLIQMNRLSSDLRAACEVPVDVTGITYDRDYRVDSAGAEILRSDDTAFQRYLYNYLVSGSSFVVSHLGGDDPAPDVLAALRAHPPLARATNLVLRRGDGGS
jgi:alpha-1,2-mannosyltransferase